MYLSLATLDSLSQLGVYPDDFGGTVVIVILITAYHLVCQVINVHFNWSTCGAYAFSSGIKVVIATCSVA